ncbi:MAG: hypothetical protein CL565_02975 [Alphaproteobacteria bacterium]|nr:hypothetical protein [Alphaproteobacteria bacterium]
MRDITSFYKVNNMEEKSTPAPKAKIKVKRSKRKVAFLWIWESLLAILVLVALTIAVTAYRLQQGPVDVSFALEKLEAALADEEEKTEVKFGKAALSWPEITGPLLLILDDVHVYQNKKETLHLETAAISLERLPLLVGKVIPRAIIIDSPNVTLVKTVEGEVQVTLDAQNGNNDSNLQPINIDSFIINSLNAGHSSENDPLYGLEAMEIRNANLSIVDEVETTTWAVNDMNFLFLRRQGEAEISVEGRLPGQKNKAEIKTFFTLEKGNSYSVDVDFANVEPFLITPILGFRDIDGENVSASGGGEIKLDQQGRILFLNGTIQSKNGTLFVPENDISLPLDYLFLEVEYSKNTDTARLLSAELVSKDLSLKASGEGIIKGGVLDMIVSLNSQNIPIDMLDSYWPEDDTSPEKEWIVDNLSKGTILEAQADIPLVLNFNAVPTTDQLLSEILYNVELYGETPLYEEIETLSLGDPTASFSFEELFVEYRPPLIPASNLSGNGNYKEGILDINVVSGNIADVNLTESSVIIDTKAAGGLGTADIDVKGRGPFSTIVDYISREPIEFDEELGVSPSEVSGIANIDVGVDFPTKNDLLEEDIKVTVSAELENAVLPRVVKNLDLSEANLSVVSGKGKVNIEGKGLLSGRPVTLDYEQYFDLAGAPYSQKVAAQIVADRALRDQFGVTLDEYIAGDVPLDIVYTQSTNLKEAKVDVKANLTPVAFRLDPLDYLKKEGQPATASAKVTLVNDQIDMVKALEVTLPDGALKNGRMEFSKFGENVDVSKAAFSRIVLPDNDFELTFQRPYDNQLVFDIKGEKADARPFLDADDEDRNLDIGDRATPTNSAAISVNGTVNNLKVSDEGSLEQVKFNAKIDEQGLVDGIILDAKAGQGKFAFRYTPNQQGKLDLAIEAEDAGGLLREMGIYNNVVGGYLTVRGVPIPNKGKNDIQGQIRIDNFIFTDAPGSARLLNAVSPNGFQEFVSGDGISFSRLQTGFTYVKRNGTTMITFKDGRTSGSEVGLTFAGVVNQTARKIDVEGTIVPLNSINTLIGKIPLIGDILTGGDALFAATYKIRGSTDDPNITVNPLSVLAPGILRKILFEGEAPDGE